jgi:hypothetical protein
VTRVGHITLINETKHKYIYMQGYLALWYCLPSRVPKMEKYKRVNNGCQGWGK